MYLCLIGLIRSEGDFKCVVVKLICLFSLFSTKYMINPESHGFIGWFWINHPCCLQKVNHPRYRSGDFTFCKQRGWLIPNHPLSHVITSTNTHWLTHDFECNMGFIFRDFYFPLICTTAKRECQISREIKIEKNKSHIAREIMR